MDAEKVISEFENRFKGRGDVYAAVAPGRVNLIGEHTDYNDGFVLPMAIDYGIAVAGRPRDDRKVKLYSMDYGEEASFDLDEKFDTATPRWSQYVEGVARVLEDETGERLPGFEAAISGDVPQGAGLSSSAALEVATGLFISTAHGLGLKHRDIAIAGRRAENDYLGMMCGIMDQFASALCGSGSALFLDCRSLEYEQVPAELGSRVFLIINTGKSRGLVDSEYNDRRRACERGVEIIRRFVPGVKALRDVTPEMFDRYRGELPDDIRMKCRHVVFENLRVLEAVRSLKDGVLEDFGGLMWQSHDSLRDDYRVSCRELDLLNEIAGEHGGVLGERMTGAGFGGCGVALLERDAVESFMKELSDKYTKQTGLEPQFYATGAAGGAECIKS